MGMPGPLKFIRAAGTRVCPSWIRRRCRDCRRDMAARRAALHAMIRGKLVAWDPVAQKARWEVQRDWPWNGGTLATAGNLVFEGTVYGELEAYSADKGARLWSFQTHRGVLAGPITYRVNGEQYVAVMAGYGGSMGMASASAFEKRKMPNGLIVAFKLGGKAQLPPYTPVPLDKPSPSSESFTPAQIATGSKFYFMYCTICHGGPGQSRLAALEVAQGEGRVADGRDRRCARAKWYGEFRRVSEARGSRGHPSLSQSGGQGAAAG